MLLEQQAYWGWFVPYRDCLTEAGDYICKNPATGEVDAASNLYHDEEQSPGWTDPNHEVPPDTGPDGVCHRDEKGNSGKGCDCGHGVACGKHLWNHKNGSMLRDYLVNHHIAHDLQNPNVDGYYLDDFWTEAAGPSEEAWPCTPRGSGAGKCSNFTAQELKDSVGNWSLTMATAQAKIRSLNGFDWQSFRNVRRPGNSTECTAFLDSACGLGAARPSSACCKPLSSVDFLDRLQFHRGSQSLLAHEFRAGSGTVSGQPSRVLVAGLHVAGLRVRLGVR